LTPVSSKEVALNDDQRRQGYPWKFYGLTEEGRTFLDEHNLLAAEGKPSNRSTRPSLTSPRRWSSTKFPSPGRRVTLTELASSQYSITVRFCTHPPASGTPTRAKPVVLDLMPCVSRYWSSASITSSSPCFTACSPEILFVDVDVAE